jgi:tetratricopeptide (TPR) repeat protein
VVVDFSHSSKAALRKDKSLLTGEYTRIVVLHVIDHHFVDQCIYEQLGAEPGTALADLSRCVDFNVHFASAYSTCAGIYNRMGLYRRALEDIDVAVKLKRGNAGYRHNRAVILTAMGRYGEAIENYEQASK